MEGVFPVAMPLRDWVAYHGTVHPDHEAVRCVESGESRTWREFDQRVGALAAGLRDGLGVAKGDRVALLAEKTCARLRCSSAASASARSSPP
jgi:fatty-acyl-CoA synthase